MACLGVQCTGNHRFQFYIIKLWEVDPDIFRQKGLIGLVPLLPLTQGGVQPKVVEEAIARIQADGGEATPELLSLTYLLSSLLFEKDEHQKWLHRRFAMFYDVIQESWAYQEIKQEGREEARRELLQQAEEARQQAEEARRRTIEVMRHTLLGVVQVRFPKLSRLAMGQITLVEDSAILSDLAIK